MTTTLNVIVTGSLSLDRQLRLLDLNQNKRRILMFRIAKKVMINARKHVRNQTDIEELTYAARKKRRADRKKMLSKLIRHLKVISNDDTHITIGFRDSLLAYIANSNQFGMTKTIYASQMSPSVNRDYNGGMASRRQAVKLIGYGFTTGKKRKRIPSVRWITQNISSNKASVLLRVLRSTEPKTSWTTTLPARSFLGVTEEDAQQYINDIFDQMMRGINYGTA